MNQLLLRGHATVAEIMRADFGEWPPKGIDLAVEPKQEVKLLSLWRDYLSADHIRRIISSDDFRKNFPLQEQPEKLKKLLESKELPVVLSILGWPFKALHIWDTAAMVAGVDERIEERNIYLNSILAGNIASTTGHEATHIMQGNHRIKNVDDASLVRSVDKIMQDFWKKAKEEKKTNNRKAWKKASDEQSGAANEKVSLGYYETGREIQARMHECLAAGYEKWGRLPGNKEELWAAMIATGVKPPEEIMQALESSKTGKQALQDFSAIRDLSSVAKYSKLTGGMWAVMGGITAGVTGVLGGISIPVILLGMLTTAVSQGAAGIPLGAFLGIAHQSLHGFSGLQEGWAISGVQKSIKTENKTSFWDEALPQVYGDLLEMYGDTQGRARMGLGQNDKLTNSWLVLLREGDANYNQNDFQRWVRAVGPVKGAEALQTITQTKAEDRKPNDAALVQAIAEQYGLTVMPVAVNLNTDQNSKPENSAESLEARSNEMKKTIAQANGTRVAVAPMPETNNNAVIPKLRKEIILQARPVVPANEINPTGADSSQRPIKDAPKPSSVYETSLKNFFEEFNQTKQYEYTPVDPSNASAGFTVWLPPASKKEERQKALTITPEKITVHAHDNDKVLIDSIRMAVQMYSGDFQVRNASPELLEKINLLTKNMLAASGTLVDHAGNQVTQVKINGKTISQPAAAVYADAAPVRTTGGGFYPKTQVAASPST